MAYKELFDELFSRDTVKPKETSIGGILIKKANAKTISYTHKHRGQWFKPEYNFKEIQIAQDTDSYLYRAIKKKLDRLTVAGFTFSSENQESLEYVKFRLRYMELATKKIFSNLINELALDLLRYNNCVWGKIRSDESPGNRRVSVDGQEVKPIAGYYTIPMENIEFKTYKNGELKKLLEKLPGGDYTQEYLPQDVIHFSINKKPGFAVATPDIYPALDDIALLRRIEENVEELIETNLFPVYHYSVGNDQYPEVVGPTGKKESTAVRDTLEDLPPGGFIVTDHRHSIEAIGSESKALRIDYYLDYFKKRVFSAIGTTAVDMGEGDSSNKSTASTISKTMMLDIEALQRHIKSMIESYVFDEILLENGVDILDEKNRVSFDFGIIDNEAKLAYDNSRQQLYTANLITHSEARRDLGELPFTKEQEEDTFYRKYGEPNALISAMGPGSAASEALAKAEASNITPEEVASEKAFTEKQAKATVATVGVGIPGAAKSPSGTGSARASAAKAKPSNQHGTRPSAKLNRDLSITLGKDSYQVAIPEDLKDEEVLRWKTSTESLYNRLKDTSIDSNLYLATALHRLLGDF